MPATAFTVTTVMEPVDVYKKDKCDNSTIICKDHKHHCKIALPTL